MDPRRRDSALRRLCVVVFGAVVAVAILVCVFDKAFVAVVRVVVDIIVAVVVVVVVVVVVAVVVIILVVTSQIGNKTQPTVNNSNN